MKFHDTARDAAGSDLAPEAAGPGRFTRRSLLVGALSGAGLVLTGGVAQAGSRQVPGRGQGHGNGHGHRRPRVLVATNEPWGTYHVQPLLHEARRQGWDVVQLVPDLSGVTPGDPVTVATLDDAPDADLLVVTGAGDWPADCAKRLRHLPLVASSLAYQLPVEAPRAAEFRRRLRAITASSPAEAAVFDDYLGTGRRDIAVVGTPQTDALPRHAPEPGTVLVLTSVTKSDETGGSAPGTELLLAAAERLAAEGRHILVGLHPREDRSLWDRYEISSVPSVQASARAEVAVGIPGTVFPVVAAVGVPLVGCTDPRLQIPGYLLSVCSRTISSADEVLPAVADAEPVPGKVLYEAVGPVGGSARRLLRVWQKEMRHASRR
ncbi:hypothetical protein Misp01_31030 [Microtetraspora sp. NBRC 13810]|uniref:hypothetical protein n=1 Tax=Microtetraspora sp. NBRC 13810 TaxID=3030990 RepID=UPI0024A1A9E5|nr:hypothetical protein [Microtetraspora sp. NBRC 13810]GLW07973.1 hypothetical protein Misp01_31030 [Microtetraspora sp. NBRC 13810]